MITKPLGEYIRELRDKADLSLRELAEKVGVSAAFLSDVELGRRFPKEENLKKIALVFGVSVAEFDERDSRDTLADIKRLIQANPQAGLAFRTASQRMKSGELSAEQLMKNLSPKKS